MSDLKIENIRPIPAPTNVKTKAQSTSDFSGVISGAIDKVNSLDQAADRSIMDMLNGKAQIHETMLAIQKVDLSMRLLLTIRNKAIEAYKEIMHMQF